MDFEKTLKEIGARFVTAGVYQVDDWFCYPKKGFTMRKKTYEKKPLDQFLKEKTEEVEVVVFDDEKVEKPVEKKRGRPKKNQK